MSTTTPVNTNNTPATNNAKGTILLETMPMPKQPKFMAGQSISPQQATDLLKILRENNFYVLPDNKPLYNVEFLQIQIDLNNGGIITVGHN